MLISKLGAGKFLQLWLCLATALSGPCINIWVCEADGSYEVAFVAK